MPRVLSNKDIEDFRDRLVEAATHLFAQKGRDAVSMRELAGALGVSPMTPYRYFKDKDEILAAVRTKAFDRFAMVMEAAHRGAKGNSLGKSGAVGEAYIKFAFDNPESYRMMFETTQDSEDTYPELSRATERARQTMTAHLTPLIEQGFLEGDPELIGHVFWTVLHGAIELKFAGKLTAEHDFDAIIASAFRALMRGYAPQTQSAQT